MKIKINEPIKPMLVAEVGVSDKLYLDVLRKHGGKSLVEVKYDGYRIQVHKGSGITLFTRNLNHLNPEVFPELESCFDKLPEGIYDGELVGQAGGIEGFTAVKKRVRGELESDLVYDWPLEIKFFDVMYAEGRSMMEFPLTERREKLEEYISNVSEQTLIYNSEELEEKFKDVTNSGLEGLVCKDPNSQYKPGARTRDWIKLKKFLTLDLTVLGVYQGEGKASQLPFAALLLGTKNGGRYETITKVGISNLFSIEQIDKRLMERGAYVNEVPENVILSREIRKKAYSRKIPFKYVIPSRSVVIETEAMNVTRSENWHSCGLTDKAYSLRIPKVLRVRTDKKIADTTTTSQIKEIYGDDK
ncbi:hypothetical protein HYT23_01520 [Candidatus Pacearchaeota archaeon]|nr:hypothetical protein [Candidatus Pacearchaeota archaeon]